MPCRWGLTRPKKLSMAATAWVIWLCKCISYWPHCGVVFECVTCLKCFFLLLMFSVVASSSISDRTRENKQRGSRDWGRRVAPSYFSFPHPNLSLLPQILWESRNKFLNRACGLQNQLYWYIHVGDINKCDSCNQGSYHAGTLRSIGSTN